MKNPEEIRSKLRDHIQFIERKYHKNKGYHENNYNEYQMMFSMAKMVQECSIEEIDLLIKNNPSEV